MSFDSFKTKNYEGAWIPFDGDRTRFRFQVQEFLRQALSDAEGTLSVDAQGPHWRGDVKLAGLSYAQTDGWGVILFSRTHEVGVDLEKEDRGLKQDYLKLAQRFFHPDEVEFLKKCSVLDGAGNFMELWMKKESYSKMKRIHLVEIIHRYSILDSKECNFEKLPKIRKGYQAWVALSAT